MTKATWRGSCACCGEMTANRVNSIAICDACDAAYNSVPIPTMGGRAHDRGAPQPVVDMVRRRWEAGERVRIRPDLSGWDWVAP